MAQILTFKKPAFEVSDFVVYRDMDAFGPVRRQALVVGLSRLVNGEAYAILCRLDTKETAHVHRDRCRKLRLTELTGGLKGLIGLDPLRGQGKVVDERMFNGMLHVIMVYQYGERSPLVPVSAIRWQMASPR